MVTIRLIDTEGDYKEFFPTEELKVNPDLIIIRVEVEEGPEFIHFTFSKETKKENGDIILDYSCCQNVVCIHFKDGKMEIDKSMVVH